VSTQWRDPGLRRDDDFDMHYAKSKVGDKEIMAFVGWNR